MESLLDALAKRPLLFDGSMGSLFYDRGIFHTRNYEELCLSRPEFVQSLHQEYVNAGADVIHTNTFGANSIALTKHGLADKVEPILKAAVKLARQAARPHTYVAGSVGPSGIDFRIATDTERKKGLNALAEQIDILLANDIDVLTLETFSSIVELEAALKAAKRRCRGVPIVAQYMFAKEPQIPPREVAQRLTEAGADVVGTNCGNGPKELFELGIRMTDYGTPVVIQPNAGMPSVVDGRTIYVANPEHFGVFARRMLKAGISAVGGCCGTTPAHTKAMLGAVRMMRGKSSTATGRVADNSAEQVYTPAPKLSFESKTPLQNLSRLGASIVNKQFPISVELTSPAGVSPDKMIEKIAELGEENLNFINVADGPRASARMGNVAFCQLSSHLTNAEMILHVCARDRNYLGLVSHLLGAHALGLRNLCIITGDPPKMGDYPFATPVYDVDSVGLLEIAAGMNAGIDPSGKEMEQHTDFVLICGAEPAAQDYERELQRIELKKKAGAEIIMTQPVYNPSTLDRFLEDVKEFDLPVMVGILPLASHRNAQFLHKEVPGMQIPSAIRKRMAEAPAGDEARQIGIDIATEALLAVKDRVQGAYIMPPFNRIASVVSIVKSLI